MNGWSTEGRAQLRDLTVEGFWALLEPARPAGYRWSVVNCVNAREVAGGEAADEDTAKAAVERWEESSGGGLTYLLVAVHADWAAHTIRRLPELAGIHAVTEQGPVTVTRGDVIRAVPDRGDARLMTVAHVERHLITLTDPPAPEEPQ